MLTKEQLESLAKDPVAFLGQCRYHEQRINLYKDKIEHYRAMALSITAPIKETFSGGGGPASKIENCVVEIVDIEKDIRYEIGALRKDLAAVREAIDFLDEFDDSQKVVLEARYISGLEFEAVASLVGISLRWAYRLHKAGLERISARAKELLKEEWSDC